MTVELGSQRYSVKPGDGTFLVEIEFEHTVKEYDSSLWSWGCGVAEFASFKSTWDLDSCSGHLISSNVTRCQCKKTGTYAVLLISKNSLVRIPHKSFIFLFLILLK